MTTLFDKRITDVQRRAIGLVVQGHTDTEIAQEIKVSRQTVNTWKNKRQWFRKALDQARFEAWQKDLDGLKAITSQAIETVRAAMADGDPDTRLKLSLRWLSMIKPDVKLLKATEPEREKRTRRPRTKGTGKDNGARNDIEEILKRPVDLPGDW